MDEFIIGRERELAQLDLSIGPGTDGLRLAMLSGPSGQGKTTIATAAAAAAATRGFRVATVNGRAGTLSTPFAPFIEAMPEFDVLLSVLAGGGSIDTEHAGIGLVNLLAELVVTQPLLLVFDDAQALDESSIAILPYLTGISERADLTLLFVEQTDATGIPSSYRSFIDGTLARRVVSRLDLAPLRDESVRQLVAHVLDIEETAVPTEIIDRAGGNPWFVKELAEAWRSGIKEIPSNIAAAATARLHSLDELGQDLVTAIAACPDGAHISWLEAMSEQKPRDFVRTMDTISASGLVREDGDIISIAHPLSQQALVEELSLAMRRAIHSELAAIIEQVPMPGVASQRARGHHLQASGKSEDAVACFLEAAEANEIAAQFHESLADMERSLEAEIRPANRIPLLRRSGLLAMQIGSLRATEMWEELARLAAATGDDETYAYALFQQYWTCNDGTAQTRLERAAALGAEELGWSARAAATLQRMAGDYDEAIRFDDIAVDSARRTNDTLLEALALEKRASSLSLLGRLDEAASAASVAISFAMKHRYHEWTISAWGVLIESLLGLLQTERTVQEAEALNTYVNDLGLEALASLAMTWLAPAYAAHGKLDGAVQAVERAVILDARWPRSQNSVLVHLLRYEALVEAGATSMIDDARSMATELTAQLGYDSWTFELRRLDVQVALRSGDVAGATELMRDLSIDEPLSMGQLLLVLSRHAALHGSQDVLQLAVERAEAVDRNSPLSALMRDEIEATQAAMASGSGASLFELINAWKGGGRPLDALRCELSGVMIEVNAGRGKDMVDRLKELRASAANMGASWDADHIASVLRGLGTRSRAKSRTTQVGPLTKRELEIARLVASGLKNSEVAGTLFLAEKTVAAHLSNIYGKVEVRSRVQLTGWIRENDAEFEATLASAS
ncbi:MAG: hypothetical protein JWM25_599 [Thermoleophilia bacterium]|nr:hypothetical protein [Thermoleophilia bacterium]MCZ4496016.1 hypothetical protein [Thermoleophilia bacterium]